MVTRVVKFFSFADFGQKRSYSSFLAWNNFSMWFSESFKKTDNFCRFYKICSAFLLFKFYQTNLNKILDNFVSVL